MKIKNKSYEEAKERILLRGANFTGASIVHVKYAREVAECYGRNVIMKWFDLISNIGSTCGFVTGFSFVSVLEFIYFFSVKLIREIRSRRNRNIGTKAIGPKTKESMSKYFEIWWNGIKRLPEATSIHGFRFIADSKRHWAERIFWLIFVVLSWYGSFLLIAAQYDAYQNNPISFVVETTYKDWDTMFPSVVELAYFKGITYYTSEFCNLENPLPECIKSNFTYYANLVRSNCAETLEDCYWNGEPFECCDFFRPMDTELGTCYAINSIQGREKYPPILPMISNRTTGPGFIKFNVMVTGNVYVLNEEDVPALTTIGSDVLKTRISYKFSAIIPTLLALYSAERTPRLSFVIAPITSCRMFPNIKSVLRAPWSSRDGLYCNCLPSCTEAEISIVKDFKTVTSESFATVEIELAMLPTERYRRNVVRGFLDLVVSTGGTGGLFLGASILSFVELLYILLIRPFCDIYSKHDDDPWYRKFGERHLGDFKIARNCEFNKYGTKAAKKI
ncbi:Uncharacterized protein OBRU01_11299 [Operophtera brumata]|uniref:Sodium channel protein Nach n=1 Tax=Operophtera brumata TaxID=104452 RepID=A0A0L7L3I4_OPEBR|nr:Uncharacterized protein OBRU01_11299 [Operophtera brumata]